MAMDLVRWFICETGHTVSVPDGYPDPVSCSCGTTYTYVATYDTNVIKQYYNPHFEEIYPEIKERCPTCDCEHTKFPPRYIVVRQNSSKLHTPVSNINKDNIDIYTNPVIVPIVEQYGMVYEGYWRVTGKIQHDSLPLLIDNHICTFKGRLIDALNKVIPAYSFIDADTGDLLGRIEYEPILTK